MSELFITHLKVELMSRFGGEGVMEVSRDKDSNNIMKEAEE